MWQVACFPFDDHNCPPLQLIAAFCQSAYSWLKGDLENVVVVHCKAGMARTGLMITCLLLYLKVLLFHKELILRGYSALKVSAVYKMRLDCIRMKGLGAKY